MRHRPINRSPDDDQVQKVKFTKLGNENRVRVRVRVGMTHRMTILRLTLAVNPPEQHWWQHQLARRKKNEKNEGNNEPDTLVTAIA
jgi:hypothetical protein